MNSAKKTAVTGSLLLFLASLSVAAAAPRRTAAADTGWGKEPASVGARHSVHSAGLGAPWFRLEEGQELQAVAIGPAHLGRSNLEPLALARGDIDSDGVEDLIAAFGNGDRGILELYRGNPDAIFPTGPAADRRRKEGLFTSMPFLSPALNLETPVRPDFVATGDFDADDRLDIAVAARGGAGILWFVGKGGGAFGVPQMLELPGQVTSMISGDVNRPDGLADLVISLSGTVGPQLLVVEGPEGALQLRRELQIAPSDLAGTPESARSWRLEDLATPPEQFALPADGVSLAVGYLDGPDARDIAVAAGSELVMIHGRDRRLAFDPTEQRKVPTASVSRQVVSSPSVSLAVGDFVGNSDQDLAALGTDGRIALMQWSRAGGAGLKSGDRHAHWSVAATRELQAGPRGSRLRLVRSHVASLYYDDLLVVDAAAGRVYVIADPDDPQIRESANPQIRKSAGPAPVAIAVDGVPVDVLPMRLNEMPSTGLVFLKSGGDSPIAFAVATPLRTHIVNQADNRADADLNDRVCDVQLPTPRTPNNGPFECTFNAAVAQAFNDPGADAIKFTVPVITNPGSVTFNDTTILDGTLDNGRKVDLSGTARGTIVAFTDASGSLIRNVYLGTASSAQVIIRRGRDNYVEGVFIGTDVTGTSPSGPLFNTGITIDSSSDNTIGGGLVSARNVITGRSTQIEISNGCSFCTAAQRTTFSDRNTVSGNYLGVDLTGNALATGSAVLPSNRGIMIWASSSITRTPNNTIIKDNVVSGHGTCQICIEPNFTAAPNNAPPAVGMILQGNIVGLNAAGTARFPASNSSGQGITVFAEGSTIGGLTESLRNVVSGNFGTSSGGITLSGNSNVLQGNIIGLNAAASAAIGNGVAGISIGSSTTGNAIGGTSDSAANLIGGTAMPSNLPAGSTFGGNGIVISGAGSVIQGNRIGLNKTAGAFGNAGHGIEIQGSGNSIGGDSLSAGNIIAHNGKAGVAVTVNNAARNSIRRNSIYDNRILGIDLYQPNSAVDAGVTANDEGDRDTGPNGLQNYPEIRGTKATLNSLPNTDYVIEIYTSDSCDPSGFGQGKRFDSFRTVRTLGNGSVEFDLPSLRNISLTATDSSGNTSEFSRCQGEAQDSIELSDVQFRGLPLQNGGPIERTTGRFAATIRYRLGSDSRGEVIVDFLDANNTPIPVKTYPVTQTQGAETINFELPELDISGIAPGPVTFRVRLKNSKAEDLAEARFVFSASALKVRLFKSLPPANNLEEVNAFPPMLSDVVAILSQYRPVLRLEVEKVPFARTIKLLRTAVSLSGAQSPTTTVDTKNVEADFEGDVDLITTEWPSRAYDYWLLQIVVEGANGSRLASPLYPVQFQSVVVRSVEPSTGLLFTDSTVNLKYRIVESGRFKLTATLLDGADDQMERRALWTKVLAEGQGPVLFDGPISLPVGDLSDYGPEASFSFDVVLPGGQTMHDYGGDYAVDVRTGLVAGALDLVPIPNGTIAVKKNDKTREVDANVQSADLKGKLSILGLFPTPTVTLVPPAGAKPGNSGERAATIDLWKDFIGINKTWEFKPPIPADGSFSSDLSLTYRDGDLPDDPNLTEGQLKIIAYNPATGDLIVHSTTIDVTNNVARARINSLERFYTLGIVGPFQQSIFNFPILGSIRDYFTGLALVNRGSETSSLKLTVYDGSGQVARNATEAISTTTLAPSAQFPRLAPEVFKFTGDVQDGWIQMVSSKNSVIAFELLGNASVLDGVAVPSIANAGIVLTGVERDSFVDTEFHIVNPTRFNNVVTLELRSEAGVKVDTAQQTIPPRGKWTGVLRALFPKASASAFRGYVVVRAPQSLSAVSLTYSPESLSALSGQRLFAQGSTPSQLYSAQLATGADAFFTRLNLVNPTSLAASLTLRALAEDGSNLAAPVTVSLAAGAQYSKEVREIFGFSASDLKVGSIVVESSITGILGDVTFGDPSASGRFRASLPLDREPATSAVFGHVANGGGFYTGLAVFNPGTATANLTLRVFSAAGVLTGTRTLTVAGRSRFSKLLPELVPASAGQAGGYFVLQSDQPLSSFALFGASDLSALSAIPAQ